MTLNTHAPYDDYLFYDNFKCNKLNIQEWSETCKNFKLQHQFFDALSYLIKSEAMKAVVVFVVGDHSPPIFDIKNNIFSFKLHK